MVEALEPKLAEMRAKGASRFSAEFMQSNREFIAELEASVVPQTLNVGDAVPDFRLSKAGTGGEYRLSAAVKSGPQVVSFYRGQW